MFLTAGFGLYWISVIMLTGIQPLPDWLFAAAKHIKGSIRMLIELFIETCLFSYIAVKLLDCS